MRAALEKLLSPAVSRFVFAALGLAATAWLAAHFHRTAVEADSIAFAEMANETTEVLRRPYALYHDALNSLRNLVPSEPAEAPAWRNAVEQLNWRSRYAAFLAIGLAEIEGPETLRIVAWQPRNGAPVIAPETRFEAELLSSALEDVARSGKTGIVRANLFGGWLPPEHYLVLAAPYREAKPRLVVIALFAPSRLPAVHAPALQQERLAARSAETAGIQAAQFSRTTGFDALGGQWRFRFTPGAKFPWRSRPSPAWLVAAAGLGCTALLFLTLTIQHRRRGEMLRFAQQLEERVQERTAELKSVNEQLAAAVAREQELHTMKSRFIATMSHELHTPLAVISCAAQLLERYRAQLTPELADEQLSAIRASVRRLSELGEEILLVSQDETAALRRDDAPLDLPALAGEIVRECAAATARPAALLTCTGDLAGAHGDARLLRRIGLNLLSNACKYSPPDAPVDFTLERRNGDALWRITDRGCGISAEAQARLFTPFHRAREVAHVPGLGLGLVIVQRAVALHGGSLRIRSREGEGTEAEVTLPLFRAA